MPGPEGKGILVPGDPSWPAPRYIKPEQVAGIASVVGFTGRHLVTAIAISFAENTTHDMTKTSHNTNGTWDTGLWQINSVHVPPYTYKQLVDGVGNGEAAYALSNHGTNFDPWVTYYRNLYVPFLPAAHNALTVMNRKGGAKKMVASIGQQSVIPGVHVPNPITGVEDALGSIGGFLSNLPSLLFRLGKILFGIILIVVGFFILARGQVSNLPIPAAKALKATKGIRKAKAAKTAATGAEVASAA